MCLLDGIRSVETGDAERTCIADDFEERCLEIEIK